MRFTHEKRRTVKLSEEGNEIMAARFGKDTVISLATANNKIPYVRNVNAYYRTVHFILLLICSQIK